MVRWLIAGLVWVLSVWFALVIKAPFSHALGVLLVIPGSLVAWFLGGWAGAILAFLGETAFLYFQIRFKLDSLAVMLQDGSLVGMLATVVVSAIFGIFGKQSRAVREEARLRSEVQKERDIQDRFMSLLNDIVCASLEADDMASMLKTIVSRTGELYDADECFITFWDESKKIAIPMAAYGPNRQMYPSVIAKPGELTLTSSVLQSGHALVIDNPKSSPYVEPDVVAPFPDIVSTLVLPLISAEQKLGAILLSFHTPHQFSQEDIDRGEFSARQVSLALTKMRLLEDARRSMQEFSGLYEISQAFQLVGDTRSAFGNLSGIMARLVNAGKCFICLYDLASDEFVAQASAFGLDDDSIGSLHCPARLVDQTWNASDQKVFCTNSVQEIPYSMEKLAELTQVQSILAAPLHRSDQSVLGMVYALNKPGGFLPEDTHLMGVFSNQISLVIQNIQSVASELKRNEELSILHSLANAATNARSEDELISMVTTIIGEKLFPDNFGIILLNREGTHMETHSSYRLGSLTEIIKLPIETGITGKVARTGQSWRVPDVRQVPEYLNKDNYTLSELCVPLKMEGRVIGVVNAESSRLNAFTQRDEDLLSIIAGQFSTSIEHLRSAQAQASQNLLLTRSNDLIRVLAQVGSRASIASNPEGVMHTLGSELSQLGLLCLIALPANDQSLSIAYTSIPNRITRLIERTAKRKLGEVAIPVEGLEIGPTTEVEPRLLKDPVALVQAILVDFPLEGIRKVMEPIGLTSETPICQLPLIVDGKFKGVLWLWGESLQENDLPAMSIFASQVAIALQNAYLMETVNKMALTDELTGIFNRRHFFELAEHEFSSARRYHLPLTAIILDIDHFKGFNDRYGHIIGDQVLRNVAQALQANLRSNDILGRYGGEEFSIIMPVTDIKAARKVALRLKKSVSDVTIETDSGLVGVHISIGVAELSGEMSTLLNLIDRADQAMYVAKSTGGDRVIVK